MLGDILGTQDEVDLEEQMAETSRVEEEITRSWHQIDESESDGDDDDDIEPEYDEDAEFDDGTQGDQDVADENME
jgi:hypothetical protein